MYLVFAKTACVCGWGVILNELLLLFLANVIVSTKYKERKLAMLSWWIALFRNPVNSYKAHLLTHENKHTEMIVVVVRSSYDPAHNWVDSYINMCGKTYRLCNDSYIQ